MTSSHACCRARRGASGKQPYVPIPHDRIRQTLTLIVSEAEVRVVDAVGTELARHRRSYDSAVVIEAPAHVGKLTAEKRQARELRRRDCMRGACPSAARFFEALARRGEPLAAAAGSDSCTTWPPATPNWSRC